MIRYPPNITSSFSCLIWYRWPSSTVWCLTQCKHLHFSTLTTTIHQSIQIVIIKLIRQSMEQLYIVSIITISLGKILLPTIHRSLLETELQNYLPSKTIGRFYYFIMLFWCTIPTKIYDLLSSLLLQSFRGDLGWLGPIDHW